MLQAQVGAYHLEKNNFPANLEVLKNEKYVERIECPDGTKLTINEAGRVVKTNP